ncbi:hypothetical protein [Cytobacillus horneckiae]|nr:hypothetical protein [Cytobacillus horneckiae]MEC1158732.1 hypothetical protein [Cytobacillus horneckiae]NRG47437.1 hypothetical protein [Bacillus sp. CRN 9]
MSVKVTFLEGKDSKTMGMGSYTKMFDSIINNNNKLLIVDPKLELEESK